MLSARFFQVLSKVTDAASPSLRTVALVERAPHLLRSIVPRIGEAAGKVPGKGKGVQLADCGFGLDLISGAGLSKRKLAG